MNTMVNPRKHRHSAWLLSFGVALLFSSDSRADPDDEALLEFHFNPADDLQIAIWLEGADGTFVKDVYVTQATAKLGIGNRSGLFKFLSSWRAPYGPRDSVLPIWAHRRGKTYPKIVFHDPNPDHQQSLGFHEATSSPESYFCRPLTPDEDASPMFVDDVVRCMTPGLRAGRIAAVRGFRAQ